MMDETEDLLISFLVILKPEERTCQMTPKPCHSVLIVIFLSRPGNQISFIKPYQGNSREKEDFIGVTLLRFEPNR